MTHNPVIQTLSIAMITFVIPWSIAAIGLIINKEKLTEIWQAITMAVLIFWITFGACWFLIWTYSSNDRI